MTQQSILCVLLGDEQKGLFTDGANSISVLYKPDKFKISCSMNFFPDFHDDKDYKHVGQFEYDAWAPWKRKQFADSLLPNVVNMYKKWYPSGNDFIKITDKDKGTVYVKVDGNRRITIGQFNEKM